MNNFIRVLLADDHPIFRHGLAMLIQADKGLVLVGEAENGQTALDIIRKTLPDVVILDLDMPVLDGVGAARLIQKHHPDIKIIFLTMHKDRELFNMLKPLKIKGYVLKDSAVMEIIDCIKKVKSGKTYISPAVAEMLLEEFSQAKQQQTNLGLLSLLTPTEKKILQKIANSKTTREISEELFVSIRTVENHRFNIGNKLKIKGNHSLVKFALTNRELILNGFTK